jgi:hypothetical protein
MVEFEDHFCAFRLEVRLGSVFVSVLPSHSQHSSKYARGARPVFQHGDSPYSTRLKEVVPIKGAVAHALTCGAPVYLHRTDGMNVECSLRPETDDCHKIHTKEPSTMR